MPERVLLVFSGGNALAAYQAGAYAALARLERSRRGGFRVLDVGTAHPDIGTPEPSQAAAS